MNDPARERPPLRLADCFWLYLPLGLTFLLVAGADPIVTTGLRHIGDAILADSALASYSLGFSVQLLVHSPLFVCREIVITMARNQHGLKSATRMLMPVAFLLSGVDLLLASTSIGTEVLSQMTLDLSIVPDARAALFVFALLPPLIAWRGIDQALLILEDRSSWVGIGTATRMILTALVIAALIFLWPGLGAVGGAMAFVVGIGAEALMARLSAQPQRRALAGRPAGSPISLVETASFVWPLMAGNLVGMLAMPICVSISGHATAAAASIAAFALARTLAMTIGAPVFAMQALVTAKADRAADLRMLVRFAGLAALMAMVMMAIMNIPPIAAFLFSDLLNAPRDSLTFAMATSALPIGIFFPGLVAAKATMRGILISRRQSRSILIATTISMLPLVVLLVSIVTSEPESGRATTAMFAWGLAFICECSVLAWLLHSSGRKRAFRDCP